MNRTQFIVLLCVYGIAEVIEPLIHKRVQLPEHVEHAMPNEKEILAGKSKFYYGFILLMTIMVSGCALFGFFGMFFFWKAAPWFFGFGTLGRVVIYPKALWKISGGWENCLGELRAILCGIVFASAFFDIVR